MKSTRINRQASQNTVAIIIPAQGVALNFFFQGKFWWCHSTDLCLRFRT